VRPPDHPDHAATPRYDFVVKSKTFAAAHIPEYWIVLLKERAVEVLRAPDPIAHSYRSRVTVSGAATLTPMAFAGPTISLLAPLD
jgi:hypothetical protein